MVKLASGKFIVRMSPDLHAQLIRQSKKQGVSLNQYCVQTLQVYPKGKLGELSQEYFSNQQKILKLINEHYQNQLEGIVLFGSVATGQAHESSDLDLLLVLPPHLQLNRHLYRDWENLEDKLSQLCAAYVINPHFTHLPTTSHQAGSLWLEVANFGVILSKKNKKIKKMMESIRKIIELGQVRCYYSHGQAYWVWS